MDVTSEIRLQKQHKPLQPSSWGFLPTLLLTCSEGCQLPYREARVTGNEGGLQWTAREDVKLKSNSARGLNLANSHLSELGSSRLLSEGSGRLQPRPTPWLQPHGRAGATGTSCAMLLSDPQKRWDNEYLLYTARCWSDVLHTEKK